MSVIKIPVGISLKEAEKEIIQKTLQMTHGSKKEAAKILGISNRKIEYKVKVGLKQKTFSSCGIFNDSLLE